MFSNVFCVSQGQNIKGTVSRDGYYFGDLNILHSTFCICTDGFTGVTEAFLL